MGTEYERKKYNKWLYGQDHVADEYTTQVTTKREAPQLFEQTSVIT